MWQQKDNEKEEKETFKHDIQKGDHLIRWTHIALWPVQVHAICLYSSANVVTIVDFGLTNKEDLSQSSSTTTTPPPTTETPIVENNDVDNDTNKDHQQQQKEEQQLVLTPLQMDSEEVEKWNEIEKHRDKLVGAQRIKIRVLDKPSQIKQWHKVGYGEKVEEKKKWFFFGLDQEKEQEQKNNEVNTDQQPNNDKKNNNNKKQEKDKNLFMEWWMENFTNNNNNKKQIETNKDGNNNKVEESIASTANQTRAQIDNDNSKNNDKNNKQEESKNIFMEWWMENFANNNKQIKAKKDENLEKSPDQTLNDSTETINSQTMTKTENSSNDDKQEEEKNIFMAWWTENFANNKEIKAKKGNDDNNNKNNNCDENNGDNNELKELQHSTPEIQNKNSPHIQSIEQDVQSAPTSETEITNNDDYDENKKSNKDDELTNIKLQNQENKTTLPCEEKKDPTTILPKSDPTKIVLARVQYILTNPHVLPPHNLFHSNSECLAVWCKTGRWSTLQATVFLHSTAAGNLKTTVALSTAAAAATVTTTTTTTVPASGVLGLFGYTTTTTATSTVGFLSVNPWVIPVLAGYGIIAVGGPIALWLHARSFWEKITRQLTDGFWAWAGPEVFVEAIESWSQLPKK